MIIQLSLALAVLLFRLSQQPVNAIHDDETNFLIPLILGAPEPDVTAYNKATCRYFSRRVNENGARYIFSLLLPGIAWAALIHFHKFLVLDAIVTKCKKPGRTLSFVKHDGTPDPGIAVLTFVIQELSDTGFPLFEDRCFLDLKVCAQLNLEWPKECVCTLSFHPNR